MCYIPSLARTLQSFADVAEMNKHMNFHYLSVKESLTKGIDLIFHLLKKYACKVAGVCWLKQENLASLAGVSVKTVERGVKFLKDNGILKIYHTKRSNGLNGNCYYVLQPFEGELLEEEIVEVESANVGAGEREVVVDIVSQSVTLEKDKLSLNSEKALKSSLKKEEEEIYNGACGEKVIDNFLIQPIEQCGFTTEKARKVWEGVLGKDSEVNPDLLKGAAKRAARKWLKRKQYFEPILTPTEYMIKILATEIELCLEEKGIPEKKSQQPDRTLEYEPKDIIYNWLDEQ